MRMLHTMLRVGNLERSLAFYTEVLGMRLLRKHDYPDGKFTLAFVGYQDEQDGAVLELTHNWGVDAYELGTAYGHIALEVADAGITVNCISPGYVWTPLVENQIPDTMKARHMTREQVINDVLLAGQPTKQFVTVEQVAAIAAFLTRDEAANITGANLSVDGGWTAA